jgi:2EXR family
VCPYTAWLRLCEVKDSEGLITGYKMVTESKLPILLYLCRESRAEALKHYSLSFGTSISPPRVYFNFHTDTAYLHTRTIRDLEIFNVNLSRHDQHNLQNMILKVRDWAAAGEDAFANFMWQFTRLRQLLILVGRDEGDRIYIENPELPAVIRQELIGTKKRANRWRPPCIYVEECPELQGFDHQYNN